MSEPEEAGERHRRSVRLDNYDYSQVGAYFVTICTHQRAQTLGQIVDGVMHLSSSGDEVQKEWMRTSVLRPNVELDEFVIMPNHMHGIVVIVSEASRDSTMKTARDSSEFPRSDFRSPSQTVGSIVRGFKAASTSRIRALLGGSDTFLVWQRNYYEHVIRNEQDLDRIREYIMNNALLWHKDRYFRE